MIINQIRISSNDIKLLQAELENNTEEACGVLIGGIFDSTANIEKTVPMKNIRHSVSSFELDPKEHYNVWDDANKNGKDIIGVYHTHPSSSAIPSIWDRKTMANFPSVWLIAGTDGINAYMWEKGIKNLKILID